jgi:hypothetical protein
MWKGGKLVWADPIFVINSPALKEFSLAFPWKKLEKSS